MACMPLDLSKTLVSFDVLSKALCPRTIYFRDSTSRHFEALDVLQKFQQKLRNKNSRSLRQSVKVCPQFAPWKVWKLMTARTQLNPLLRHIYSPPIQTPLGHQTELTSEVSA
jgi:hypothetical protein